MVKIAKPNQDMRFDVPVIGVKTIEVMRRPEPPASRSTPESACCWMDKQLSSAADSAEITIVADQTTVHGDLFHDRICPPC